MQKNSLLEKDRYIAEEIAAAFEIFFKDYPKPCFMLTSDQRFTRMNPLFLSLLGVSHYQALKMKLKDIFFNKVEFYAFNHAIAKSAQIQRFPFKMLKKNGKLLECLLTFTTVPAANGTGHLYAGYLQECIAPDKGTNHKEKMTLSGSIAKNIAHEVRNPLTNITLAAEQLTAKQSKTSNQHVHLQVIKRNTRRINELIIELLDSAI